MNRTKKIAIGIQIVFGLDLTVVISAFESLSLRQDCLTANKTVLG
jgi:hypothetical protein